MDLITETIIFLAAAALLVPLIRRAGFSSVLGYLAAGLLIGRFGLVAADPQALLRFAEIGVVMLLFVIGLELQPSRLRAFRRTAFGLGLAQVVVTSAVFAIVAHAFGLDMRSSVVVGMALSLSSTAMVLQLLAERKENLTTKGRAAFGVLLFQDVAVIPMLAAIPLLTPTSDVGDPARLSIRIAVSIGVTVGFLFAGRFLLRPILRAVASAGVQEAFTAFALLLVLGSGLLFESVGLSMGLGAFLAGVLVADSEYRHRLETDIEPFKGLLLGLFFMAVGLSANIDLMLEKPSLVLGLAAGLIVAKALLVYGLARAFSDPPHRARGLALLLAQGGEFAFVILSAANAHQIVTPETMDLLVIVVTTSMVATPFVLMVGDGVDTFLRPAKEARAYDSVPDEGNPVIIAGFGRFGQIIGRLLATQHIAFTALESSASHVDFMHRFGIKVYYGDPRHRDLLRAAHAEHARILIIAVDDMEASIEIAEMAGREFPSLQIYARARTRRHALRLMALGVKAIRRETFLSSLDLGTQVLEALGHEPEAASKAARLFRQHDEETLVQQLAIRDDEAALLQSQREAAAELQFLFEADQEDADQIEPVRG